MFVRREGSQSEKKAEAAGFTKESGTLGEMVREREKERERDVNVCAV